MLQEEFHSAGGRIRWVSISFAQSHQRNKFRDEKPSVAEIRHDFVTRCCPRAHNSLCILLVESTLLHWRTSCRTFFIWQIACTNGHSATGDIAVSHRLQENAGFAVEHTSTDTRNWRVNTCPPVANGRVRLNTETLRSAVAARFNR
jgi:hypothetical protein